ncbi:hypothetical protein IKQ26_01630 [bacterium]|nr:hypothetical protein [bacterium]
MLVSEELMERINELGCELDNLQKVGSIIYYCLGFDFYIESRHEITSLFSIYHKSLTDAYEEYEKISYEIEFEKPMKDMKIKRNNEDDED